MKIISRITTGYKKAKTGKVCEDARLTARVKDAVIAAIADGHGDEKCVYADIGAALAVETAVKLFKLILQRETDFGNYLNENRDLISKSLICGWAKAVLTDYAQRRPDDEAFAAQKDDLIKFSSKLFQVKSGSFSPDEFRKLQKIRYNLENAVYAVTIKYGTTLKAVVATDCFAFCLGVGDDDAVGVSNGQTYWLLPKTPQFSTSSRSMCDKFDKVYDNIYTVFIPFANEKKALLGSSFSPDLILLSTDGLRNSFLSDGAFAEKISEIGEAFKNGKSSGFIRHSQEWIEKLTKNGVFQDDICFCAIYRG